MSVDNVLAIAGPPIGTFRSGDRPRRLDRAHGCSRDVHRQLLQRYPVLSYVGVALIVYVGGEMIWEGSGDLPEIMHLFR
jgi:predicted tellurium resistance membrane protein TerC